MIYFLVERGGGGTIGEGATIGENTVLFILHESLIEINICVRAYLLVVQVVP